MTGLICAADLEDLGLVGDRPEDLGVGILLVKVERRLEALEDAPAQGVLARLAVVQEIGRREEAGHRLHAARGLVDRVLGVGVAGSPAVPCISDRCPPAEPPVMPIRSGSIW